MLKNVRSRRIGAAIALSLAGLVGLAGCSGAGNDLAKQWQESGDKGYVSGNGATSSYAPEGRTGSVEFSGETESGDTYGSADTLGSVTVVNFWYAGCAPCRAEAPDLVAAYEEFTPQGVKFLGVNTRDQVEQARQFSEEFGIEYPSIMDNPGGRSVQKSFAGNVPLNAVPTTLVLDTEGRVAHSVLGLLAGESQLRTLINETLAEQVSGEGSSGASAAGEQSAGEQPSSEQ